VSTFAATAIGTTTATLNAAVNPNGFATTAKFQIGPNTGYGTDFAITLSPPNGNTLQNVSVSLTGLNPGATYHFHAIATNSIGTTDGGDLTFTTISTDANLTNLTPSSGALAPTFAIATTGYTDSVSNATNAITFTPVSENANATIQLRVNGGAYATAASGNASGPLALNIGVNGVDILVTAQDTLTVQTYSVAVTRRTPYQDWAVNNGLGLGNVAMDINGDSDGDGVKNIHEWAFGMNPASSVFGGIQMNGATLTARGLPQVFDLPDGMGGVIHYALFDRRKDAATVGLTYVVEFSDDLSSWTPGTAVPSVVASDSEIEAVIVPIPQPVTNPPAKFFRVRVTAQ
jgi:hypothetical protein